MEILQAAMATELATQLQEGVNAIQTRQRYTMAVVVNVSLDSIKVKNIHAIFVLHTYLMNKLAFFHFSQEMSSLQTWRSMQWPWNLQQSYRKL